MQSTLMQPSSKMFLGEERNQLHHHAGVSTSTFNFKSYFNADKAGFGSLVLLNDDVLFPGASLNMQVKENCRVLIIPVTGELSVKARSNENVSVEPGQVVSIDLRKDEMYTLINNYSGDEVHLLQLWLADDLHDAYTEPIIHRFDTASIQNRFAIITEAGFRLNIGQFGGRFETTLSPVNHRNEVIFFVLSGAFEIEGRLVQPGDGVGIGNAGELGIEALSDNATLIAIEWK